METIKGTLIRNIIVFVSAVVVGFALIVIAFLLPTAPMREHLGAEMDTLALHYHIDPFPDRPNADLDFDTDYHMLAIAANEGTGNVVERALSACYLQPTKDVNQLTILQETVSPTADHASVAYARYWHGYLIPLKLQLLFADYYSILLYNGIALLGLFVLVAVLMTRRGLERYIPALVIAVGLVSPVSITMSMQYYACSYISLISIILILAAYEKLTEKGWYSTLFMLTGMATSYMDFLTTPIVTLGLPLTILGLLQADRDEFSWKSLVALPIHWAIGFGGMWAAKWAIATPVMQRSVFEEAMTQVTTRTSGRAGYNPDTMYETLSFLGVVKDCLARMLAPNASKAFVALYALASVGSLVLGAARRRISLRSGALLAIFLLVVALLPFLWTRALENHTYMHTYFTFRMYVVAGFALCCVPFAFIGKPQPIASGKHMRSTS